MPDERRSETDRSRAPRRPLIAAVAISAAAALGAATVAHPAFDSPELHVAIETACAVIAVLAAYLMVGRYMFSLALRDLALIGALTALALGNIAFSTVPALMGEGVSSFGTWAPVGARLVAAAAFAAAAFVPEMRIGSPRRAAAAMLAATTVLLGLVAILAAATELPTDFGTGAPGPDPDGASLDAPLGFLVAQVLGVLLFAAAALGFSTRARRTGDELIMWFGAAAAVAAFSRLNYFLYPPVDPDVVVLGDVLRIGFYLLLLGGALREVRRYQRRMAVAAVLDERRRMARDLHDGLAQELAYVVMQARRMVARDGGEEAQRVAEAAENALGESRQAIAALSRRPDEPFEDVVAQVAGRLTARAGVRLRLQIDSGVEFDSDRRDQLLNIVQEAVSNGVRHGGAEEVSIALTNGGKINLTVSDDGAGFDLAAPSSGFGLTSMRERAEALGGKLEVDSRPGGGTRIQVELP